jgi:hypothetical protein
MEISNLQLWAMLFFNTAFCILVPRLLTTKWLTLFSVSEKSPVVVTQKN